MQKHFSKGRTIKVPERCTEKSDRKRSLSKIIIYSDDETWGSNKRFHI